LKKRGLGLAAISYDSVDVLKHFTTRRKIEFPLLSDVKSEVIRRFGILNESVPAQSPFYGVPHPVTYIVDRNGIVVARHAEEDFRRRPTTGAILSQRSGAGETIRHPRLTARTSASNEVVRGGERIKLYLGIELPPGMHVYAPGVEGYIAIDWRAGDSAAIEAGPVKFPRSRIMHLEAIDERVPVYSGRVELWRDIVIGQPKEAKAALSPDGTLTVSGTLRFQACDATKCYTPDELPLSWKFTYEQHDPTRVPAELRRVP
jgi:hypothetical protein